MFQSKFFVLMSVSLLDDKVTIFFCVYSRSRRRSTMMTKSSLDLRLRFRLRSRSAVCAAATLQQISNGFRSNRWRD